MPARSHIRFPWSIALRSLLAVTLLLFVIGCEDDSDPSGPGVTADRAILVAGDVTLTAWDTDDGSAAGQWGLGNAPNAIAVDPGDGSVVVVNSLSHTLQRFTRTGDDGALEAAGVIDLGLDRNLSPFDVALDGAGRAYVSNLLGNSVSVVDLAAGSVVAEWPVGLAPEGLVVHDTTLLVLNTGYDFSDFSFGSGSLYRLGLSTGTVLDTLALGVNPQFAVPGSANRLHVSCTGDYGATPGELWTIGLEDALTVLQVDEVGLPVGRMTRLDERIAVAAGGWASDGDTGGLVLVYDTASSTIDTLHTGMGVVDVAFDLRTGELAVSCREAMRVEVYDTGLELVRGIPLDDPPNALTVQP